MSAGNFHTYIPQPHEVQSLRDSSWVEILTEATIGNLEEDGSINPLIVYYSEEINNTIFTLDLSPMFQTDEENLQTAKYQAMIQSTIFGRAVRAKESVLISEGMFYDKDNQERIPCIIMLWYNYQTQEEKLRRITVDPDNTKIILKDYGWIINDNQD